MEIREKDAAGKLLGIFCGQVAPTNLTTQSATWIKFRSGSIGTGKKGFLADYNLGNRFYLIFLKAMDTRTGKAFIRTAG